MTTQTKEHSQRYQHHECMSSSNDEIDYSTLKNYGICILFGIMLGLVPYLNAIGWI